MANDKNSSLAVATDRYKKMKTVLNVIINPEEPLKISLNTELSLMKKQFTVFIVWFITMSVPLTYLMGLHTFAFANSPIHQILEAPEVPANSQWKLIHLLSVKCGCSKRAAKYLSERGPQAGKSEIIFALDGNLPQEGELIKQGFTVVNITSDEAEAKYGINSVPQLVVLDPHNELKYSGGYNDMKVDSYEDLIILSKLEQNQNVSSYPVFGCASSKKLSKLIDPWGFKYGGF